MTRTARFAVLGMLALGAFVVAPSPARAGTPAVYTVVEGKDTGSGKPVLVLLGNGLTSCKTFELTDGLGNPAGEVLLEVKSRNMLILALPEGLGQGTYTLTLGYGRGLEQEHQVMLSAGQALPGTVPDAALSTDLRTDLDDAATLGGHSPDWYCDATNVDSGVLDPARFSAWEDLVAESKVGAAAGQVAAGDHLHDSRYYTKTQADSLFTSPTNLSTPGTINTGTNPVDWTKLKNVPAGFADGVDANTTYTAAASGGLSLSGTAFSASFGGTGTAATVARSDHGHDSAYFTESELSGAGTINTASNPVDWTKLKNVPAGFADGTDADAWTTSGSDVHRSAGKVGIGTTTPAANLHVTGNGGGVIFQGGGIHAPTAAGTNRFLYWADRGALTGGFEDTGTKWVDANVGRQSIAWGEGTYAKGISSVALGWQGYALGDGSVAMGYSAETQGSPSVAIGRQVLATGVNATALGEETIAQAFSSIAMGRGNAVSGSKTTWVDTDPLFVVGNGTFSARKNALTLLKNGDFSASGSALFTGTYDTGTIPATGAGVRMMWYPKKAAFRAGYVVGTKWDDANVGYFSLAAGVETTASGQASVALGVGTTAQGSYAVASGYYSQAEGDFSFAMGYAAQATGDTSTAFGDNTLASGSWSTAMGVGTEASGAYSTALGDGTTALGVASTSMGFFTYAQPYASVVLGRYNVVTGTTGSWVATDPVLVVGNGGSSSARANCFTLLKNGNLTIAGTLTQSSDGRMKKDVVPVAGALRKVAGLRGVSYFFKDASAHPSERQIGLVAQEVREVLPELVQEGPDGTLSVAYGNLSAVLVEAVKEQQAEIEKRDREVEALRRSLAETKASFEERLARLEKAAAPK